MLNYREDRVPPDRLLFEGFAAKGYGWLISRQVIEDRRLCLRGRGGYPRCFDVIDFDRELAGSSDPICDVLVKDLSTYAGSIFVAKTAIEILKGGIHVVSDGGPDEVVNIAGVVGK